MNPQSFSYIDIHSHVNFVAFDADREATIRRALDAGVAFINVGTQKDTSQKAVEIAEKSLLPKTAVLRTGAVHLSHSKTNAQGLAKLQVFASHPLQKGESYAGGIYATVGLHPIHTSKSFHDKQELGEEGKEFTSRGEEFDYEYYKKLARHPKVVGIGECGLDFFRIENKELRIKQEIAFKRQVELAMEIKKPLMLHLRNGSGISAYDEAYKILYSLFVIHNSGVRGNLHFFAGTWNEAKPFLDLGFNFSFTGVITFTHDYNEIIKKLPLERIMAETDCPYVTPAPYRGKRNEPAYVIEVVKKIAEIRGEDFGKVREVILDNTLKFFGL